MDITSDAVVAQIGIDPGEQSQVVVGQVFDVRTFDDRATAKWKGTVSLMAHSVNPATRLIDATLTLSGDVPPRPGTPLRARAALAGAQGVIIPRAALVPEADQMIVFVVRDGTAKRTPVTIAQRGGDQVTLATGCAAGDHVVVSGQSQLTPGATVREVTAEQLNPTTPAQQDGGPSADH
jgi:HlyD family secretion protein